MEVFLKDKLIINFFFKKKESAGAMSIVVHLVSPLSQKFNYFQSAIVESDPAAVEYRTKEEMAVSFFIFVFKKIY